MAKDSKKSKKKETITSPQKEVVDIAETSTKQVALSPVAQPMAASKLTKKLLKTVKKASKAKNVKRGVKEVVKGLRKGSKGLVIIAGDIFPIDVMAHLPVLCEENNVPYIYVSSKEELGIAGATKRATSCIMVTDKVEEDYKELYSEVLGEVKPLNESIISIAV